MRYTGIILIAAVILIYLFYIRYLRREKGILAKENPEFQTVNVTVKGVYSPNVIIAKKNKLLKINFLRQESTECSRFVSFPDFKIRKELPQNQTVTIEIMPDKAGEFTFNCDMSMYLGKLIIK